jgi:putative hydrolase of the HAD superfamily
MWTGALHDALTEAGVSCGLAEIRSHLRSGFPWHTPDVEHHDLKSPEAWWARTLPLLEKAAIALGMDKERSSEVALAAKANYLRIETWELAAGVIPILADLHRSGWRSVIISNHVPELPDIVEGLSLSEHFEYVFCSAALGVEKPHAAFFAHVLASLPQNADIWVIGDSVEADIKGASAAGLGSILIGASHPMATHCVASVGDVPNVLRLSKFADR